jgi:hypothetical protein
MGCEERYLRGGKTNMNKLAMQKAAEADSFNQELCQTWRGSAELGFIALSTGYGKISFQSFS